MSTYLSILHEHGAITNDESLKQLLAKKLLLVTGYRPGVTQV